MRDRSRAVRTVAVVLAVSCAVVFLFPVLASPVNADDRYWYLWVGWRADGSVLEVFRWSWERLHRVTEIGRVNALTQLERRLACLAVIEAAVATGTPIVVYQALLKLCLAAGSLLSGVALVRSLRWRDLDGGLVRAGWRTLLLVGTAGAIAIGVGAQAQGQTRNGWTAYPVNTYSAAILILGSAALLLWLTRLVAERSVGFAAVAAVALATLAVLIGLSYELNYPAVPVAALALLLVPVTDRAHRRAGLRAKLVTGLAYTGTFTAVFAAIRIYVSRVCAGGECYEGVTPAPGGAAVRTAFYNLISVVPGAGGNELRTDLELVGWEDRFPVPPTSWSVAIGVVAAAALVVVWWMTRDAPLVMSVQSSSTENASTETGVQAAGVETDSVETPVPESNAVDGRRPSRRAESALLAVGSGLALLVAAGTAALMGLSEQSHELITEPGTLYRNAMVTWTGLAFCGILGTLAIAALVPRLPALATWTVLAVVIGSVGALTLPSNLMALRANRVSYQVVEAINWEVVQGDILPGSNARRCALFRESVGDIFPAARAKLIENANLAFRHYHGRYFCTDRKYPGGPGRPPSERVQ